ncbi:MAG: gamma-glutamyltransferase, partial [Spirochaetota bacterium]
INSNFMGFGTGIVPRGCGFSLQNRGYGFSLRDGHPNALAPRKRPYHTIIPGIATDGSGGLHSVFGVMGGMMQPQGHLQVISAMIDYGMDPQAALDRPRFQLEDGQVKGSVLMEKNLDDRLSHGLHALGHDVRTVDGVDRYRFGLGQIIRRDGGVFWAGSDSRGDGLALADGLS